MKIHRSHILESLSEAFSLCFFSEWVCNKLFEDDGLDFKITIVENEMITAQYFFIILKVTESIDSGDDYIKINMNVKDLKIYLLYNVPILLILYDSQLKKAYWVNLHRYCWEDLDVNKQNWKLKMFIIVKIPKENELIDKDIIKEEIFKYTKVILRNISESFSWSENYFFKEINDHLKEIGISEQEAVNIENRAWIFLLNYIALLSLQSFNKKNSFQEQALSWKKEKEMQEWFDFRFRAFEKEHDFIIYHSEADAGGGECEHFINNIPIEDKVVDKSDYTNIHEFLEEQYKIHYPQVRRYAIGKQSKYVILLITDKREEIINSTIRASSPNNCLLFQYNKEDNLWCAVFAFQVVQKSPSQLKS